MYFRNILPIILECILRKFSPIVCFEYKRDKASWIFYLTHYYNAPSCQKKSDIFDKFLLANGKIFEGEI